jgi:hypothetical protein
MHAHASAHIGPYGGETFGATPKKTLAAAYFLPLMTLDPLGREVGRISSKTVKNGKGSV